ncbi:MAG: hypothetical protein GY714_00080 [Desulfobacterales bacterium]|nr:hypothetical protein [Desulfobacterales bacterium]
MKFLICAGLVLLLISCIEEHPQNSSTKKHSEDRKMTDKTSMTKEIDMVPKKNKTKRGCSGYYFFIRDHLEKLRLAKTPYTGSNSSGDFVKEWEALTPAEREKYNNRSTSK